MDDMPDPGPPPPLPARSIFVYLVKRMNEHDDRLDKLIKNSTKWRYDYVKDTRRSNYITIATAVAHGVAVSAGWMGGILAGSYVLVEHTWYWHKILGWFHAV